MSALSNIHHLWPFLTLWRAAYLPITLSWILQEQCAGQIVRPVLRSPLGSSPGVIWLGGSFFPEAPSSLTYCGPLLFLFSSLGFLFCFSPFHWPSDGVNHLLVFFFFFNNINYSKIFASNPVLFQIIIVCIILVSLNILLEFQYLTNFAHHHLPS